MELAELEARHRRLVWPLSGFFLAWYLLLVVLAGFARPLMAARVAGTVTFGYLFALSQFPMTFLVAWYYTRTARHRLDPLADQLAATGAGGADGVLVLRPVGAGFAAAAAADPDLDGAFDAELDDDPIVTEGEMVPLWPTAASH